MVSRPLRYITNHGLLKKLESGVLKDVMDYASKRENELDIQIRGNYMNIYYKGGSILKINPRSFDFDKNYFYTDSMIRRTKLSDLASKGNVEALQIIDKLEKQRNDLLDILRKEGDAPKYFDRAKFQVNKWLTFLKDELNIQHQEKEEQQYISMNNHNGESDYTVLDLEYAVSTNSPFSYNGTKNKVRPRFDIIAIDNKTHHLCAIELKKGMGATGGVSGIEPHIDCFTHTIGRDNEGLFLDEMKKLLEQKQAFGYICKEMFIADCPTEFVFAFADIPGENKYAEFIKSCKGQGFDGKIIYLDKDSKLFNR